MKKIVISNLNSQDQKILFYDLSIAETETVSGGGFGGINNYFITSNTGDFTSTITSNRPSTIPIPGEGSGGFSDNKVNTIDFSRSIYILINSF